MDRALPDPGRGRYRRARGRALAARRTLDQAQITTACMIRYVRWPTPSSCRPAAIPTLEAFSERCEALPEFKATWPAEYAIPRNP